MIRQRSSLDKELAAVMTNKLRKFVTDSHFASGFTSWTIEFVHVLAIASADVFRHRWTLFHTLDYPEYSQLGKSGLE